MPIFHDATASPPGRAPPRLIPHAELQRSGMPGFGFERPLVEGLRPGDPLPAALSLAETPESLTQARKPSMIDRNELIERLKRSNSPSWHQGSGVSDWLPSIDPHLDHFTHQGLVNADDMSFQDSNQQDAKPSSAQPISRDAAKIPLSPPVEARPTPRTPEPLRDLEIAGLEIERPRSALHSGDFREKKASGEPDHGPSSTSFIATSPVVPWNRSFPAASFVPYRKEGSYLSNGAFSEDSRPKLRTRAISQSTVNSFTFLPPTSPLVQQANNTDLDFSSRPGSPHGSRSPEGNNRRHTFSPTSFQGYQSIQMARSASGTPAARHIRHGSFVPYQAHQPRRAATFNQSQPQTPYPSSRRPSFSSEASPLQHAPMVGSYEESILRGRMSTTPSRPLNFVAKIGVLGKGQCKSSLKCPPHVTVPFPAVFYSYDAGNGRISNNEPSPYVGLIDLENSLAAPEDENDSNKRKRRQSGVSKHQDDARNSLTFEDEAAGRNAADNLRKREKKKRRSTSPKAPPGGCYRIPAQGQLQIVLKNPNKTAVKLFLVPYDLSDMEPGQKTFIRQRSYSAGPIIDLPASTRSAHGTNQPGAALRNSEDANNRPRLRYLIHVHICCPSKDRYYLYKSIRVVFANRVPDGKEKMRNEIQFPEPRYSAYKPLRDPALGQSMSSMGGQAASERALRRRSAGLALSQPQATRNDINGPRQYPSIPPPAVQFTGGPLNSSASSSFSSPMPDLQPIPFSLLRLAAIDSRPVSREYMEIDPSSPFRSPGAAQRTASYDSNGTFEKLNKGEIGYGGNAFSPPGSSNSNSLLSQGLRGMEFQRDAKADSEKQ